MISLDDIDNAASQVAGGDKNPIDEAAKRTLENQRTALKSSLYGSLMANPDMAARAQQLGKKAGIPADVAERNLPDVQRQVYLNSVDKWLTEAPSTAEFLSNPDNAKIAHDDVDNLVKLNRALSRGQAAQGRIGEPMRANSYIGPVVAPDSSVGNILSGFSDSFVQGAERARQGVRMQLADALGIEAPDALKKYKSAAFQEDLSTPAFGSDTATAVYGGGASLLRTAPGLLASILTRNATPTLAAAGVQTQADAYGKYKARGATGTEAFVGATGEGTTEVLTELLPMGFLTKNLGKVGAGQFLTGLLAREIPSEQVATLVQDAIDTAVANPEKTWSDYANERGGAAYNTLVATLVQSLTLGGVSRVIQGSQKEAEKAQQAEQNTEALTQLDKLATASKLRARDPDSFEQFVAQASAEGPVNDLYINAQTLAQSGIAEQLAAVSPSVAAQFNDAMATGGDVRIPLPEYAARIAGTEYSQSLLDHLKTEPEGMSRAEAQQYMQTQGEDIRADVERVLREKQGDSAFQQSADDVKEVIRAELEKAGNFSGAVNDHNATLAAKWYAVTAAKLGVTPRELFDQHPLTVSGADVGGQVLGQGNIFDWGKPGEGARDVKVGDTTISYGYDGNMAHIISLRTPSAKRNKGSARAAMVAFLKETDALGVPVRLESSPLDKRTKDGRLFAFYKSLGFEPTGKKINVAGDPEMIRQPQASLNQSQPAFDGPETGNTPVGDAQTVNVDGVERTVFNSNGKPIHPTLEGVRNFWRWFGDSKVVDAEGRPLVVYHGTGADFDTFDPSQANGRMYSGGTENTAFFSDNPDVGSSYAGRRTDMTGLSATFRDGGNVMPAYLKVVKPLKASAKGESWRDVQYKGEFYTTAELTEVAKSSKKDGMIVSRVKDYRDSGVTGDNTTKPSTTYAVFSPNQIKSATGNAGAFDPENPNILMQSGQGRDLVVTHNLTAENLLHAVKMGGLPVPSLAVTKKDSPLTNFGEITLVGSQEMVDPKGYAKTKVFGADIYSPRYPSVERELDKKAVGDLQKRIKPMAEKLGLSEYLDQNDLQRNGQETLERNIAVMGTFLTEKGIEPQIEMRQGIDEARRARLVQFGLKPFLETTSPYELRNDEAFQAAALAEARDTYAALGKRDNLVDAIDNDERFRANIVRDLAERIATDAKLRKNPEADVYPTQRAMEKQIVDNGLSNEYQQFVLSELDRITKSERIFQGFTYSGNRKYIPHTLENVVKILKKELRGGENFNYGVGSLRAKFTPQFKSVADIRKNKDRLISADEFTKVKDEIDADFLKASEAISPDLRLDTAIAILEDAAKVGVVKAAKDYSYEITPEAAKKVAEFLTRLRNLPTAYFEAKILRDVDLAEFSAAVVPEGVDEKVIKALESRGVKDIRVYKKGDEADRAAKIGEFENLFFQRQAQANRGSYNPATNTIALLKNADLSTFLHESGHMFLELQLNLASKLQAKSDLTEGERSLLSDTQTLLDWFGIKDLNEWHSLDFEEKRSYHEKFARGFEAYLFEGKAPSFELQKMFQTFRAWLLNIYKSLKALNVELTDEVRGVMDRMLATNEEIRVAQQSRSMLPLFSDPEKAGLSPEEFAAYHREDIDATNEAAQELQARSLRDMQWLHNARGREIKRLQKESAELRKAARAEVSREVMARPIYQAWQFLTAKPAEGVQTGKLNTDALIETYGGEGDKYALFDWKRLTDKRMVAADGFDPNAVAEKFGFASGDELVRKLVSATSPNEEIDALTDIKMLEEHGELSSADAIARAADVAIHNSLRAKVLATEANALAKAVGNQRILASAAKEYAGAMIARLKLKDVKPKQYTAAEARAGKLSAKAFAKDDLATAATEKRNQLINHYAARAAYDAQDEIRKIDAFFKKVVSGKDEAVTKTRDMDMVNAARAVLANFGYGQKAKSAAEYLKAVEAYDPAIYEVLKASVDAAEAMAKPAEQLTVEELRGLYAEVDALWFTAKRNRQMEIDGDLLDRQEAVDALRARMEVIGIPETVPGDTSAMTPEEERALKIASAKAIGRRVESWVDLKDGANKMGAFRRFIWNPIKEAADRYRADKAVYIRQFRDAFSEVAPSMKRELIAAPELNYTFGKDSGGVAMNEVLHALLHTGNESNLRKLLVGRNWASETEDGRLDTSRWDAFIARMIKEGRLTKAHYDFVQRVWDTLEAMKPAAQKAHREAYGKYFAEVTANEINTPFGTYRGGYAPAQVDSRIVKDNELKKLIEEGKDGMAYAFPGTSKGFTKSRVDYNKPLMLDLRTLPQHIDKVLLFSHLEMPVRDVAKLIAAKGVNGALNRIDPAAVNGMLMPWLNRSARQQVTTPVAGAGWMMRMLNTLRNRTSMATMFANVSNTAQQVTGFSLAALKVKPSNLLSATADYMRAPKKTAQAVAELSSYMSHRMDNEVSAMMGEVEAILLDPNLYQKAQEWTKRHTFFMQSAVDNVMGPIIWKGAFNQALEEGYETKDAVRIADSTVRQTQGSTLPEDVSRIETGPAYARLFTQFAGYFNMQANLLGTEFAKVSQEMGVRKGMGKGFYIFLLGFYAPALVAELIAQAFRGGPSDDDKDGEYLDDWLMSLFVYGPMRNLTAFVPFVGQTVNSAVARFNHNPTDDKMSVAPVVGALEAGAGVPIDLYKAVIGEDNATRTIKDVATLISITTGLPASVAARPLSYAAGIGQDKVDPTGPVDLARGLITGAASPESKTR